MTSYIQKNHDTIRINITHSNVQKNSVLRIYTTPVAYATIKETCIEHLFKFYVKNFKFLLQLPQNCFYLFTKPLYIIIWFIILKYIHT